MRILFIEEYLPQEMLGIMYLSRALKNAGHDTRCLFLPDKDWVQKMKDYDPQVIAMSYTTGLHEYFMDITRQVKKHLPKVFVVHGGPHPSAVPEFLLSGPCDAFGRGEGEVALVELCDRIEKGLPYTDTRNFVFKDEHGKLIHNPTRPLMTSAELEAIGFPDREVIYDAGPLYRESHRKVFVSLRGCPMDCTFCFHHSWRKKVYAVNKVEYSRKRSVSHLIEEVKQVRAKYPLRMVHFVDDIFNIKTSWLEEFAERWPKEVGLPFDCILMANMTTDHHIALLKKAGCIYSRIAIEAANDHIRNQVYKKNTTRQQLLNAAGYIKKHGIRVGSLNMIGAPGSTIEDEFETLKLNVECGIDHPLVSLLQPYPMTDINDMTAEMGYATDKWDKFSTKFNRTSPISFDNRHEFENFHKLFPIAVRNPWLVKHMPALIKMRWLHPILTVIYMLHSEILVSEQNKLYNDAQGFTGVKNWFWVDFTKRVAIKGTIRVYESIFGKISQRLAAAQRMGDERTIAHMD
jgi:anaerobic magnesium-protoporphyrin IX monomethyl ester cyclase